MWMLGKLRLDKHDGAAMFLVEVDNGRSRTLGLAALP